MTRPSAPYLRGQRIEPKAITGQETVAGLIENAFLAYNAGRLREACQLFTQRMLEPDTTVGIAHGTRTDARISPRPRNARFIASASTVPSASSTVTLTAAKKPVCAMAAQKRGSPRASR